MPLNKGMVLLTTLILLFVMSALVMSMLQGVLLARKISNQTAIYHQTLYALESMAQSLSPLQHRECLVHDKTAHACIAMLHKDEGCLLHDSIASYRAVIMDLGFYPCIQAHDVGTQHWLFSIMTVREPIMVLQMRVAMSVQGSDCKEGVIKHIVPGVVSWRVE